MSMKKYLSNYPRFQYKEPRIAAKEVISMEFDAEKEIIKAFCLCGGELHQIGGVRWSGTLAIYEHECANCLEIVEIDGQYPRTI